MIVRLCTSLCYIVDMVYWADGVVAWTWCEMCCGIWLLWGHLELKGIWETFSLLRAGKKKVVFPLCNCSLKRNKLCNSVFYYEVRSNCLRFFFNKNAFQKVSCPPPEDRRSGRITLVIARTTITQPLPTIQHQWTTTQATPTVTTSTSIERIYPKTAIE